MPGMRSQFRDNGKIIVRPNQFSRQETNTFLTVVYDKMLENNQTYLQKQVSSRCNLGNGLSGERHEIQLAFGRALLSH